MPDFSAQFTGSHRAGPTPGQLAYLRESDAEVLLRNALAAKRAAERAAWCLHHVRVAYAHNRRRPIDERDIPY